MKPLLVVFSGLDGAGKSTQIDAFLAFLRARGADPAYLWTRGGYTPGFNALKAAARRVSGGRAVPPSGRSAARAQAFGSPWKRRLWLIMALLDLMWVYGVQIRWWRAHGRPVVCDRYLADTLIDFRLNFPQEQVERWWFWRVLERVTPAPDAAFLLLVPVAESLRRSQQKNEPFPDSPQVLAERLQQYQRAAAAGGWVVLDGREPVEQLARTIQERVSGASGVRNAVAHAD